MDALVPETFSSLISDIYDCALDPKLWSAALTRVTLLSNAAYSAVSLADIAGQKGVFAAFSPWDPVKLLELNEVYGAQIPGLSDVLAGDLDTPFSTLTQMPETQFQSTRFYQDWVAPQGLRDACIVKFAATNNRLGLLSVVTRANRDIITADERRFFQLISPHLRRAALIGDLLGAASAAAVGFRATLDTLASPVVLTDGDGRVRHRNASADALLATDKRVAVQSGIFTASSPVAQSILIDAIKRASTEGGTPLGNRGIGIPLSRKGELPIVAYVLPLGSSDVRGGLHAATVAVFISIAGGHVSPPDTVLMTLFDLTGAEARVMLKAGTGAAVSAIAIELGLSENTVKTHLGRVYSKTNTERQAELVALSARISGY